MHNFNYKRITDPIHGTIGLSEIESEIISTKAFQRLRNVKHLGLAHLVFPAADFSRFSHSLGVCHITGQILQSLKDHAKENIDEVEIQKYRLAALLHDIGHYPFSHATEKAIENYYSGEMITSNTENSTNDSKDDQFMKHERVGKEILETDQEIKRILHKNKYNPIDVYSIFLREKPPKYSNLISSDLDADRMDYLLRMSHHTGMPYGSVDLPYLLSQIKIDKQSRICITNKALRTADHLLLSRYFAYQQVAYHKTVFIFEHLLQLAIKELLKNGLIGCSKRDICKKIQNGDEWHEFDDYFMIVKMRELLTNNGLDENQKLILNAVLHRRPPKLVYQNEYFASRENNSEFHREKQLLKRIITDLSQKFDIDKELCFLSDIPGMKLTKIGSHVPLSSLSKSTEKQDDEHEQAIHIFFSDQDSRTIMEVKNSLSSILSDQALYTLRLYVLLPHERVKENSALIDDIKEFIKKEIGS